MVFSMYSAILSTSILLISLTSVQAQEANKFHITPEEQTACQGDATTLCSDVFPDEDALISCMRSNVSNLTPVCRRTFTAGLQRRHM